MVYQLESPDINTVINYCKDLCANDKIEVYDFGGKKDLVLHIYKDEDFDQKTIVIWSINLMTAHLIC